MTDRQPPRSPASKYSLYYVSALFCLGLTFTSTKAAVLFMSITSVSSPVNVRCQVSRFF